MIPPSRRHGSYKISRYWRDAAGEHAARDMYIMPVITRGAGMPECTLPNWFSGDYSQDGKYGVGMFMVSDGEAEGGPGPMDTEFLVQNASYDHEQTAYIFLYDSGGNPCGSTAITLKPVDKPSDANGDPGPKFARRSVRAMLEAWPNPA